MPDPTPVQIEATVRSRLAERNLPPTVANYKALFLEVVDELEPPDVEDRDRCVATIDGQRCPRHGQMYLAIAIPPRLRVLDDGPIPSPPEAAREVSVLVCLECAAPATGDGSGITAVPCLHVKSARPWTAR